MTKILFPNFLTNPNEYAQAEKYWQERWDALVKLAGQEGEWKAPWLQTTFADGTPFHTGDPIFSAISNSRDLAIRVIQHESETEDFELDTWVECFGEESESNSIRVLVISCTLSEETVRQACDAMYSWMIKGALLPLAT